MQESHQPVKRKRIPLANVAVLLVAATLAGQLLGFLRTKLVNANFPITGPDSTDAYFAAFTIPDLFFYVLAAGVLGVAFIPVLSDRLAKNDRKAMWELSSSILNFLCLIMLVVGVVIFVFAEPLISNLYNMSGQKLDSAVFIMRCLALTPLLFTVSGILTAVQQTLGRFFFYAVAPLFYNLAIIASIYIFPCHQSGNQCTADGLGLKGLGIGALAGGVIQLLVVLVGLYGTKFRWHPKIMWRSSDFKTVVRQLPPRSLDQGLDQVQTVVETSIAGRLREGTITYYNNAYILQMAPIMLIGTAISTAAFPRLTARLSQGRPDLFRKDFLRVLRFMIWVTIPVVIIAYLCRGFLARLIFAQGSPDIATIFGFLTAAIFFRTIYTIISRWFYAQKDTKTPLFVSIFTIGLSILLAIILARPTAYGAAGLALSVSISAAIEVLVLSIIMVIRDRGLLNWEFWRGVIAAVSVSGFSMMACYFSIQALQLGADDRGVMTLGGKLAMIVLATFAVHISVSGLFGMDEARPVFNWIKRIILRPIRGAY